MSIEPTLAAFSELHPTTPDQLLPLLHYVQQAHGCIPMDGLGDIALVLNVSRAEVFGVVSFYEDFVTEPRDAGVEICGAEACQALGCRSLLADARAALHDRFPVREVFCLGNCATGPSARVGDRILGRATLQSIRAALHEAEGGP